MKSAVDKLAASHLDLESTVTHNMAEMTQLLKTIQEQNANIGSIQVDLTVFKESLSLQEKRLDDLEDRSRRTTNPSL